MTQEEECRSSKIIVNFSEIFEDRDSSYLMIVDSFLTSHFHDELLCVSNCINRFAILSFGQIIWPLKAIRVEHEYPLNFIFKYLSSL